MDDHAQQEIQDYAKVMYEMVKPEVPAAAEAFEDYIYNSVSMSRMEMTALKYAMKRYGPEMVMYIKNLKNAQDVDFGLSKREWNELVEKLK